MVEWSDVGLLLKRSPDQTLLIAQYLWQWIQQKQENIPVGYVPPTFVVPGGLVWCHLLSGPIFFLGGLWPGGSGSMGPWGHDTTAHPVDRMTNRYKSLQFRLRAVMILEKSNDFGRHDRQNSFITYCVFVLFCSSGTTSGWRGTSRTSTTSVSSSSLLTGCGCLTYH